MNPLMFLMSGCFGGYNTCGMSPGTMSTLSNIWGIAGMQSAMQCGLPFGGIGTVGGLSTATPPYKAAQNSKTNEEAFTSAELKVQMEEAEADFNKLNSLCQKVNEYKNDTETKRADLETNVANAYKSIQTANENLKNTQEQLAVLNKQQPLDKAAIQDLQAKVKAYETEKKQAEEALDKARTELDAFTMAQEENEEEYNKLLEKREAAYSKYKELSDAYLNALTKENNAQNVINDRADDKDQSGKWWNRTVLNPENWFNKKVGLWGDDKSTPDANIAKCLRLLNKKGRSEALAYAQEQGLITVSNGQAKTEYSELQGLVNLYNGRDPVAQDPLEQ